MPIDMHSAQKVSSLSGHYAALSEEQESRTTEHKTRIIKEAEKRLTNGLFRRSKNKNRVQNYSLIGHRKELSGGYRGQIGLIPNKIWPRHGVVADAPFPEKARFLSSYCPAAQVLSARLFRREFPIKHSQVPRRRNGSEWLALKPREGPLFASWVAPTITAILEPVMTVCVVQCFIPVVLDKTAYLACRVLSRFHYDLLFCLSLSVEVTII